MQCGLGTANSTAASKLCPLPLALPSEKATTLCSAVEMKCLWDQQVSGCSHFYRGDEMKIRIVVLVAVVGFLGFLAAGAASAQEFNCASQNMRRNYCSIPDPRANVELVKQNSDNPCVRGQTWGNDGRGIWVDRGCRGTFRVTRWGGNGPGGPPWWNSGGRPPQRPRDGACFYRDPNFGGDYFCQARGTEGGRIQLNNDISSIQVSGHTTVTFYDQPNFSGNQATTRRSVADLKRFRLPNGSTWNNRISSVVVN